MTASQLVAPMGLPPQVRVPHSPNPVQLLRAKRCLFGVSNSDETERIFKEDERRRLEDLQRYVIIPENATLPSVVIDSTEQANNDDSAEESTEASGEVAQPAEASVEVAEAVNNGAESNNGGVADPAEANNDEEETTATTNTDLAESNGAQSPNDIPTRFNPGPLGCFRVRKTVRGKPYVIRAPKDCFHPPRSSRV